jgi:hypothetical protein
MVAFSEPAEMMILIANILRENGVVRYFRSWSYAFRCLALSVGPVHGTALFPLLSSHQFILASPKRARQSYS